MKTLVAHGGVQGDCRGMRVVYTRGVHEVDPFPGNSGRIGQKGTFFHSPFCHHFWVRGPSKVYTQKGIWRPSTLDTQNPHAPMTLGAPHQRPQQMPRCPRAGTRIGRTGSHCSPPVASVFIAFRRSP